MGIVSETLKFEIPPKEKVQLLVKQGKNRSDFFSEIADCCQGAADADRAICLAAVNQITKEDPEFVKNHLDFIISQLDSRSAQVKLEAGDIIGRAARTSPDQAALAIPRLMQIIGSDASIVRESAAYALAEIAKCNKDTRKELIKFFKSEAKKEKISSVRNLYLDALTALGKGKPQNTSSPETS